MHPLELIAKAYENSETLPHLHPANEQEFKEWARTLKTRLNSSPQNAYVDFFSETTKVRLYRPNPLYK